MIVRRLVVFGHEVLRWEVSEDADKTLVQAAMELLLPEGEDGEEEEPEPAPDLSWTNHGRTANELEHIVFPPVEEFVPDD